VSDKSWRHKWQKIEQRKWGEVRASWVGKVPHFSGIGSAPDPGLENLSTLLAVPLPSNNDRFPDVAGLRSNALWEAVFLFHKCAHTHLAAQRIGQSGMHSWSLFNAYHSAYLGARGIMTLLGAPTPFLGSGQLILDLFPEPSNKKKQQASRLFEEFVIIRLGQLTQRYLWQAFQHVLRITDATCWDVGLRDSLAAIDYEDFSRPRNKYLYRAAFWPPFADLMADCQLNDDDKLYGRALLVEDEGFLFRLCFSVYRLFEQLIVDLGSQSAVIKEQVDGSRVITNAGLPVVEGYSNFVSQLATIEA
jgi:hypothetical protein